MTNGIKIFSGNANLPLAQKIVKCIRKSLGKIDVSTFKDGEIYVRIGENVRGTDAFIIQPTSRDVNTNIMELAIIIDALKRASAARVTAVIPYFGYARQDRKARGREPITAKLVANLIAATGADRVLTIDLHAPQIQGFFDIPLDHLQARPLFAAYFRKQNIPDLVVVAPDAGGTKKALSLARSLRKPLVIIDKRRIGPNKIGKVYLVGEVKDKNCIIIDDIIDTAGTMTEAAKALKNHGAKSIYLCATHAILSEPALQRLGDPAIKEVIVTDTILHEGLPEKFTILSLAPLLAESVKRIHEERSVSALFKDMLNPKNKHLRGF